jgi:hypothetical protein
MCKCGARALTTGLVCCGLLFAPLGAKNPPAAAVGQLLSASVAGSTVSIGSALLVAHPVADTMTGALHRLPTELPRAAVHEPDKT